MEQNFEWLPHIYDALTDETYGYTVTPYSIALEGWRRGLELTFLYTKESKSNSKFSLSDGRKKHIFSSSRGDLVARKAVTICKNKYETKKLLEAANVPTPKGQEFSSDVSDENIISYANEVGYPLVIKPVDGTGGKGVITNIKNEEEFKKDLEYIRNKLNYRHVIVEQHFSGEDYRVYVVGDEVIAVAKRFPPNVIGDGTSTIRELIKQKNEVKKGSKLYRNSLIKIDTELKNFLQYNNLSLETVPEKDTRIFVKSKNNVSVGGDPVDATDELFTEAKDVAVRALHAIPDMPQGGVDVMVNHNTKEAIILEINSRANIRLNLFPLEGKGRDIPKAIIDYYFPETKQNKTSSLIFDYGTMWRNIKYKKVQSYPIPNHPTDKLLLTRFIVTGNTRNINFGKWIKEIADQYHIHGYIKHLENGTCSIVIAGNSDKIDEFRGIIKNQSTEQFPIIEIKEMTRKTPVMIGFTIENPEVDVDFGEGYYPVRLKDPKRKSKTIKKSSNTKNRQSKSSFPSDKTPKENNKITDYEKEYKKIIDSTSWKITKPIRFIKSKITNKKG